MTAKSFTNNITRHETFEGTLTGTISSIGGGPAAAAGTDFVYQGAQSLRRRIQATGSEAGFTYTTTTQIDSTAAATNTILTKSIVNVFTALNPAGSRYGIGNDTSNYHNYQVGDDGSLGNGQFEYIARGGFILLPINPNLPAWRNLATVGTVTLTQIDFYRYTNNVSATSVGENQAIDSIDYGRGFYAINGDGGSPVITFFDFLDQDEGEASGTADRWGLWSSRSGIMFVFGGHVVGRNSSGTTFPSEFTDTLQTLVFPGGYVDAGWNALEFDITDGGTIVDLSTITMIGQGRTNRKRYFDTELGVNGTTEVITSTSHGFITGDEVLYSNEGGTTLTGLTNNTPYYVRFLTTDTFELYDTCANAFNTAATTGRMDLTAAGAGTGQGQSLRRQPDTRPDLTITGTTGSFDATNCTLVSTRNITLQTNATLTGGAVVTSQRLNLNGGTVNGVNFDSPTVPLGEAYLVTSTLANISNSEFVSGGQGHAIEIDTTGTFSFSANDFSGYGPAERSFDTQGGVNGGTEVITLDAAHGYSNGDPVYYQDQGGTTLTGLTDGQLYFVRAISATEIALYLSSQAAIADTNRVNITAAGSPETHWIYSANAALYNSSGGLVTVNVSNGGGTPSVRNSDGSTTVINNTVTLTLSGLIADTEVRIFRKSDNAELAGTESSGTSFVYNYNYTGDVDVWIVILHIDYLYQRISYTLTNQNNTLPIQYSTDRVYANPA